MDLKARKKQPNNVNIPKTNSSPQVESQTTTQFNSIQSNYTHSISIRCNALLYNTIQNWIISAHTAQDFTYTSIADVIRGALEAYRNNLELTELDEEGTYKQTTIRVTQAQAEFYQSLPSQLRRKILERAIRTFIKNQ